MDSGQVKTTVVMELEGKVVYAVSDKELKDLEALIQSERLIPLTLEGKEIFVQSGSIEYLQIGDKRPSTNGKRPLESESVTEKT